MWTLDHLRRMAPLQSPNVLLNEMTADEQEAFHADYIKAGPGRSAGAGGRLSPGRVPGEREGRQRGPALPRRDRVALCDGRVAHGREACRAVRAGRHRDRGRRGADDPAGRGRAGHHAHARLQGGPVRGLQVVRPRRRGHRARQVLDVRAARLREGRGLHPAVPGARLRGRDDRAPQLRRGHDQVRAADPGGGGRGRRERGRHPRPAAPDAEADRPEELALLPGPVRRHHGPRHGKTRSFSMANTPTGERHAGVRHQGLPGRPVLPAPGRRSSRSATGSTSSARTGSSPCGRAATPDLVLVGGGAGMAPILALLRALAERGPHRNRPSTTAPARSGTCASRTSCTSWSGRCPSFRYVPALSEPDGADWDGETGFVTDVLKRRRRASPGPTPTSAGRRRWSRRRCPCSVRWASRSKGIYYDKFTTTGSRTEGED